MGLLRCIGGALFGWSQVGDIKWEHFDRRRTLERRKIGTGSDQFVFDEIEWCGSYVIAREHEFTGDVDKHGLPEMKLVAERTVPLVNESLEITEQENITAHATGQKKQEFMKVYGYGGAFTTWKDTGDVASVEVDIE